MCARQDPWSLPAHVPFRREPYAPGGVTFDAPGRETLDGAGKRRLFVSEKPNYSTP
jgi:hypothetical protein